MNQESNPTARRRALPTDAVPHRLFHTMVVLGSSLAAACGGSVDGDFEGSGGASTGDPSASGGASATGGGLATSGGAEAAGGSSGGGARAYELECAPSQIACEFSSKCEPNGRTLSIFDLDHCICDPSKPAELAACPDDQDWVCLAVTNAANDVVPFDCSCQPYLDECAVCPANGRAEHTCDPEERGRSVLCGCAVVLLR